MTIEKFLTNTYPSWMTLEDMCSDIVMSTRIRLARNLAGIRFPICFSTDDAQLVETKLVTALVAEASQLPRFAHFKMKDLSKLQRQVLVEKHLISPNLALQEKSASVFLTEDESTSIMINEEDHLRIQCLAPAMQIHQAYEQALQIDQWLQKQVQYAYHEQYGYLTSCPTNVGTGLRASVMLHLPALTMTKKINHLIQMITRLGMVVRGIYGEGSENSGNVYQISNQITLGKSSTDILHELQSVVEQVIKKEKAAREQLLLRVPLSLEDRVSRSLGTLYYARILTSDEAAACLSNLRLGVALQLVPTISQSCLNECLLLMQPGFIQQYAGTLLQPVERDTYRAKMIQSKLQQSTTRGKGEGLNDV